MISLRSQLLCSTCFRGSLLSCLLAPALLAQHAEDNAVTAAEDAFGTTIGHESIGIYGDSNVRGFSPIAAGNFRIEGMYCDAPAALVSHVSGDETIHTGISSQGYCFPAPTGIADTTLRPSGNTRSVSTLLYASALGTTGAELDAQLPLVKDRLSTALGASTYHYEFSNGGHQDDVSLGLVPRWHPSKDSEVTAFYGLHLIYNSTFQGLYIPTGDFLPPPIRRGTYPGPDWDKTNQVLESAGLLAHTRVGDWTLRAGGFYSYSYAGTLYPNLIVVNPDGSTERSTYAQPPSSADSFSGELRASREFETGTVKQLLTTTLRGRHIVNRYGDGIAADFGTAGFYEVIHPTHPDFQFGPLTRDTVDQATAGLSYGLRERHWGDLTLGLQYSDYDKQVRVPGKALADHDTRVWLPSLSLAHPLGKHLVLYGSLVRGIEDAGSAPNFASNAGQVLSATRTHQWDAGLKWKLSDSTTLIAGYFDVSKPYLTLNSAKLYGQFGDEVHRGMELSLSTSPVKDLRILLGGVFSDPKVSLPSGLAEDIGHHPVGQCATTLQLNSNYTLPFARAFSVDASVYYQSCQAATNDNRVTVPGLTLLGLGGRYTFKRGKVQNSLRLSIDNLTNAYRPLPAGSGVYVFNGPRNARLYLSSDF